MKIVRETKNVGAILNEAEAVNLVRRIGLCELKLEAIALDMNLAIKAVQTGAQNASRPILEVKNELTSMLRAYCDARREEFKERRSRETLFGRYGFRFSSYVAIEGMKKAKDFLRKFLKGRFVRITERIDRAGLQAFLSNAETPADQIKRLAGVGIKVSKHELWFVEPDLEKIKSSDQR